MLKTLRLHQGLVVYLALLWLVVVGVTAAVLASWPILLAALLAMIVLVALNLSAIRYWNHFQRGSRLYQDGQFFLAEVELRPAQSIAETFRPLDPRRGQVLNALVALQRVQGNYDDAESLGQQAVALHGTVWGAGHPITLDSMQNLGGVHLDIARYPQAQPLFEKIHNLLGDEESFVAMRCLQSLGRLWLEQGRPARAEPYFHKAWQVAQNCTSPLGRARGQLCCQMARLHLRLGRIDEAERFADLAVALAEQRSASGLPAPIEQGQALALLAQVRLRQKRLAQAEGTALRSLAILEKAVAPNTPIASETLLTLGEIHLAQERWQDAETRSRQALKLREEYLAPEHPLLADTLETLARALPHLGRLEEAELHQQRAAQIRALYDPLRLVDPN